MLTMYDSIDLTQIPKDAKAVAGYVNGSWPTFQSLERLFPKAKHLSITVAGHVDEHARCCDVEPGDATAQTCLDWLKRNKDGRDYLLWTAHYTHEPHVCGPKCGYGLKRSADATQYTDHAEGRNLDASKCHGRLFTKPHHPVVYTSLSGAQGLVDYLASHGVNRVK